MKLVAPPRVLFLAAVLLSVHTGSVLGQGVYPVEIGDRVRVSVPMQIDGDVVGFGEGALIIRIPNHIDLTSVPLAVLQGLEVQRVRTKSLLFDVLGGSVAGVGAWLLVDPTSAVGFESIAQETDRRTYMAAFAAIAGAAAGALIGKRYKSFSWEVVPLASLQSRRAELDGLGFTAAWALPK